MLEYSNLLSLSILGIVGNKPLFYVYQSLICKVVPQDNFREMELDVVRRYT